MTSGETYVLRDAYVLHIIPIKGSFKIHDTNFCQTLCQIQAFTETLYFCS